MNELALYFGHTSKLIKLIIMAQNNTDKKQVSNTRDKNKKGDTDRTSNEGRKAASGGSKETNNRGHRKDV
jgi:hypothetical protein